MTALLQTLEKIKTERLTRDIRFSRESVNEENRTVELSFSSEDPYERWFGYEILDHSPDAVNLNRLADGGPLLMDHNSRDQVGVVENVRIDSDRVGRATVRFGKSQRAEEVFADVLDGIRQKVSVGYRIEEMTLEKQAKGEPDTYRVTKWQPFEISLVAVPADNTVGVGRSETPPEDPEQKVVEVKNNEEIKMSVIAENTQNTAEEERARVLEIMEIGKKFDLSEFSDQAINNGMSVHAFRKAVMDEMGQPKIVKLKESDSEIGLDKKEVKRYSLLRAINAAIKNDWSNAGLEREASLAAAKHYGKDPQGFFLPMDILKRDLTVGTATEGGHLVSTDLMSGSFIDLLRKRMVIMSLGTQMMTGLVGDIAIPRQTGGATAYWLAEAADATESQQAFDRVTMSPKTVAAFTEVTRKLVQQSSIDVEQLVMSDLAKTLALAIDLAAINGLGSSNQPRGILNTSGIGSVAGGTDGLAPSYSHIIALETEVAADDADVGSLSYLTNTKVRGKLKGTEKATNTAQFVWQDGNTPLNGYKAAVSNQVPSNLTKGTSSGVCSAIIFGNFNDLLVGWWGALDILVNPYAADKSGGIRITAFQDSDVSVRHPESFAAMKDALTA